MNNRTATFSQLAVAVRVGSARASDFLCGAAYDTPQTASTQTPRTSAARVAHPRSSPPARERHRHLVSWCQLRAVSYDVAVLAQHDGVTPLQDLLRTECVQMRVQANEASTSPLEKLSHRAHHSLSEAPVPRANAVQIARRGDQSMMYRGHAQAGSN